MANPEKLTRREFSKVLRGYNPEEVDAYVDLLCDKYNEVFRDNAELEKQLNIAMNRLDAVQNEEAHVKNALLNARKAGDVIIDDATKRADLILQSVRGECDEILASFREKIDCQKKIIADISDKAQEFKDKLYECYKVHIEELEKMPVRFEFKDDITNGQYIDKVMNNVKRDISDAFPAVDAVPASGDTIVAKPQPKAAKPKKSDDFFDDAE